VQALVQGMQRGLFIMIKTILCYHILIRFFTGEVNHGDRPTFLENYPSIILQLQATSHPTDA
jgi:hypothetical protein